MTHMPPQLSCVGYVKIKVSLYRRCVSWKRALPIFQRERSNKASESTMWSETYKQIWTPLEFLNFIDTDTDTYWKLFLKDFCSGFPGEKRHIKHKLFALVNVQMALGRTAGCPRVNRAKKFMCSPRNTGNINFSLWLTGGLSQGRPGFQKVYVFKVYLYRANGRGRFGGQTAGAHPKASPRAQVASLCSAGVERASKVLAGLAFCEMLSQYSRSAFQGLSGVAGGGGGSAAVCQTLRVHLLGTEFMCLFLALGLALLRMWCSNFR